MLVFCFGSGPRNQWKYKEIPLAVTQSYLKACSGTAPLSSRVMTSRHDKCSLCDVVGARAQLSDRRRVRRGVSALQLQVYRASVIKNADRSFSRENISLSSSVETVVATRKLFSSSSLNIQQR